MKPQNPGGQSIFCLPHRPKISGFFDLCIHWVSVVRGFRGRIIEKDQIPFLSVNISFLSACSYICSVKNGPNFWRANLFVWIRRGDNDDVTQCKIAIYLSKCLEYIGLLKQVNFFFVKSQDANITTKQTSNALVCMGCHHSKNK